MSSQPPRLNLGRDPHGVMMEGGKGLRLKAHGAKGTLRAPPRQDICLFFAGRCKVTRRGSCPNGSQSPRFTR